MKIRRGEVWVANLEPSNASEPGKVRPVVVVQSNLVNTAGHSSIVICLLSSQQKQKEGRLRILVKAESKNGLEKDSFVLTDQIRAIDVNRFQEKIGAVDERVFSDVINGIKVVLDI
ncbi:MAG TPA: type II toxin-antitoxin system PemK/MazF family toxin [Pelobium sp.]|nr:type II toxin-antitoxin system PemK/MazF family toxin [Pelobium sp.]